MGVISESPSVSVISSRTSLSVSDPVTSSLQRSESPHHSNARSHPITPTLGGPAVIQSPCFPVPPFQSLPITGGTTRVHGAFVFRL